MCLCGIVLILSFYTFLGFLVEVLGYIFIGEKNDYS